MIWDGRRGGMTVARDYPDEEDYQVDSTSTQGYYIGVSFSFSLCGGGDSDSSAGRRRKLSGVETIPPKIEVDEGGVVQDYSGMNYRGRAPPLRSRKC